jgi:cytidine deaminase
MFMNKNLNDADLHLAQAAQAASAHAYAPYSGFAVGAAVRTKSGNIYIGANLENASYGMAMCAEVAAITAANSAGDFDIEAIAICGMRFHPHYEANGIVTPCGRCRQILFEASQVSKEDIRVLSCSGDLGEIFEARISELLLEAFGPANLGLVDVWPTIRECLQAQIKAVKASTAVRRPAP